MRTDSHNLVASMVLVIDLHAEKCVHQRGKRRGLDHNLLAHVVLVLHCRVPRLVDNLFKHVHIVLAREEGLAPEELRHCPVFKV